MGSGTDGGFVEVAVDGAAGDTEHAGDLGDGVRPGVVEPLGQCGLVGGESGGSSARGLLDGDANPVRDPPDAMMLRLGEVLGLLSNAAAVADSTLPAALQAPDGGGAVIPTPATYPQIRRKRGAAGRSGARYRHTSEGEPVMST